MNDTSVTPAPTDPTQVFTTFTNSAGQKFMIHGLSPMLPEQITNAIQEEWKASGKSLPAIPTYEVITATGEKEIHAHDAVSIHEGPPETVKLQEAQWSEYSRKTAEFQGDYSTRLMKKVFLSVATEPTDKWREEMEFLGIPLPKKGSPAERYKFVENEVIQSLEDVAMLQVAVLRLAGIISPEGVEAAKASFRSFIREATTQATPTENKSGQVESQPVL
jgi:hypothetical protein